MPKVLDHDHWWSGWMPKDRVTVYRYCQSKNCSAVEEKEAMA